MEMKILERSIESIRVSRKEKADGTVVRIKETFLSDGTSYKEEKIVSLPATSTSTPEASQQTPNGDHQTNDKRLFHFPYGRHPTRDHSIQFLPTSIDKPTPITILPHYRLPESKSSRVCMVLFRFYTILAILLILSLAAAWALPHDRLMQAMNNLFNL